MLSDNDCIELLYSKLTMHFTLLFFFALWTRRGSNKLNCQGAAVDEIMDRIFTHEPNHEKRILTIIFLVSGSTFARIVEHLAAQKVL